MLKNRDKLIALVMVFTFGLGLYHLMKLLIGVDPIVSTFISASCLTALYAGNRYLNKLNTKKRMQTKECSNE